jgi:hypothetical protein
VASSFFDDEPATKERPRPEIDLGPIETQGELAVREDSTELSSLSRLARDAGPRDIEGLKQRARAIGYELGQILDDTGEGTRAFYRWWAGSGGSRSVIEGPTVDLMDALGHEYGRIVYSVRIVAERGPRVTLRGKVVDLLNLVAHERDYSAFLREAPAKFAAKPDERERWRVMQLQAAESRAIRGVLEHVVPAYLVDAAMNAAKDGAARARLRGVSLPEAIGKAVETLRGCRPPLEVALVERWVGRPAQDWSAIDLGEIRGVYRRWTQGLLTPDGLRVEAHEREVERELDRERQPADTTASTAGTSTDRLDGLGLGGGGGPSAGGSTSPSTATTSGAARDSSSVSGASRAAPPASTSSPQADRRAELLGQLAELRSSHPAIVTQIETVSGVVTARTAVAKIESIVAAVRREIADLRARVLAEQRPVDPSAAEPEWKGPTGAELRDEVLELCRELGAEPTREALAAAGIPQVDGAPERALRVMLRKLLDYLPDEPGAL